MFFPFFENLKNISQYNSAYYAAIASVERWELVLRYKNPWFQWTGGFEYNAWIWPVSDKNWDFGIVNSAGNGMRWTINSRTKSVPSPGWWNVDVMLADSDSSDYNMIDYSHTEIFNLGVDNTTDPKEFYRTGSNIKNFSWAYISGVFRLPPKVFQWFDDWILDNALLCGDSNTSICDSNSDGLYDDAVINRTLKWEYSWQVFSIIPSFAVNYNSIPAVVSFGYDSFIRESLFDDQIAMFSTALYDYSPVNNWYSQSSHNVIWEYAGELKDLIFSDILRWTTWLSLKFSLMDLLRSRNANIYPFLEYKFDFSDYVSDRFYNIQWVGKVWDYNVRINVNKPTSNESAVGEFTIIF